MTGDQSDMAQRLKAVLPSRWFPDTTPVLDGLLAGLARTAAWVHDLVVYARQQTRIATATDSWLDIIAQDCFGSRLVRRIAETDDVFRARIKRELLRPRATRAALIAQVTDLTGYAPSVFEPSRPADTGGWGVGCGYGGAGVPGGGGWGSLVLPFQCFVVVRRPTGAGIPNGTGYGQPAGGYGVGALEYGTLAFITGAVTDADIMTAIAGVMPVCGITWTRIEA